MRAVNAVVCVVCASVWMCACVDLQLSLGLASEEGNNGLQE